MADQRELYAEPPPVDDVAPARVWRDEEAPPCSCDGGTRTITRADRCKACDGRPKLQPGTVTVVEG